MRLFILAHDANFADHFKCNEKALSKPVTEGLWGRLWGFRVPLNMFEPLNMLERLNTRVLSPCGVSEHACVESMPCL